jgi:hypothetical protein
MRTIWSRLSVLLRPASLNPGCEPPAATPTA